MQVIINAAFLPALYAEEYNSLLSESFRAIALQFPEHDFVFICSLGFKPKQEAPDNVKYHIVKTGSFSGLKNKYRFDISIPRILNKYKANVFVTPVCCSLNTTIPQCLLMHLPDIINYPSMYSRLEAAYYKKNSIRFIKKAEKIIALSVSAEKSISAAYPSAACKINVSLPVISSIYKPVSYSVGEAVKNKYTGGKEFFLYGGSTHPSSNLHSLLKAFSLFKKRQQSSTKLVIVSLSYPANPSFVKSIASYKFRHDIVFIENCDEIEYAALLASAYAFVYPVLFNGLCLRILQAVYSHIPVVASQSALANELAGNAALFVDASSQQDIADKLMRIYKDESLRNELINNAAIAAGAYKLQLPAQRLWQNIAAIAMPSS
ncbi:MAG: glycosyltransferase [Chitinophagaceae bacterium]|nr:glycosyltransferase [Chitinophagaceae bacterium]